MGALVMPANDNGDNSESVRNRERDNPLEEVKGLE